ncbi:hypothetical protein Hte_010665 [Hypoxylon texense]
MSTHLAAISPGKGQRFEVRSRPTPKPGPGELLVAVKSVAINPADGLMRDQGLFIPSYPTVIGFDIAGLVLEVGDDVPTTGATVDGLSFQPGVTRVAAYSASYWKSCDPDYGAFQERCLVPWQHAVPLPDDGMSWNYAATLPVAVQVLFSVWDALGILRVGEGSSASSPALPVSASASTSTSVGTIHGGAREKKNQKREAILIWGASSSVGTMGVQGARLLREDSNSPFAAVYATAGPANERYVRSLGADRVFDYRDPHVAATIVSAAREDGLVIRRCFLATGQLAPCQAVLQAFLGDDDDDEYGEKSKAEVASAPIVPANAKAVDGVETIFVHPSTDKETRLSQFRYWMGTWLRSHLACGIIRPSPEPTVVGKGLGFINAGLDMVLQGVSCTKLVVEVEE